MSESAPSENNESSASSSTWLESLFRRTETPNVARNRSNCVSNTTSNEGDGWSRIRQLFQLPSSLPSTMGRDSFHSSLSNYR